MKRGRGERSIRSRESNERREKTISPQEEEWRNHFEQFSLFIVQTRGDDDIAGENIGDNIGDNIGRNKSENEFFFETSPDE